MITQELEWRNSFLLYALGLLVYLPSLCKFDLILPLGILIGIKKLHEYEKCSLSFYFQE
jgi:hypothetical protein